MLFSPFLSFELNLKKSLFLVPNTSTDELSKVLQTKTINEKSEVEIDQTKVTQAGNDGSIAVLTACIGCFIGILMTSFIFICCNPCYELTKKRQRHLSTTVSIQNVFYKTILAILINFILNSELELKLFNTKYELT